MLIFSLSTFLLLEGENICILGDILSFSAFSINLDSTFLKAFCHEGVEPSAFSNLRILFFNLTIF